MKTLSVFDNDGKAERTREYIVEQLVAQDENDGLNNRAAEYEAMADSKLADVYTLTFNPGR